MTRSSTDDPGQRLALTERQEQILRLIERGRTNAEIADQLGITLDGVTWHVREILSRLEVESREDAVTAWKARRRTERRAGFAGLLFGMKFAQAAGLAAVVGVAGAGVIWFQGGGGEPDDAREIAVTPPPALSATNKGLTLKVLMAETDGTQLTFELGFEGRPDVGAPLSDWAFRLADDKGNPIGPSGSGGPGPVRGMRFRMQPLPPGVSSLIFVAESVMFETGPIDGPWAVVVRPDQLPAPPATAVGEARPVGAMTVVLDEVRQSPSETLIYAHMEYAPPGVPPDEARRAFMRGVPALMTAWSITDATGVAATLVGGRTGHGDSRERVEFRFAKISGPVTIRAQFFTATGEGEGLKEAIAALAELADLHEGPVEVEWQVVLPP
ncbi:MAG: helix-turn-helix transcriptional regulator [Dehalococcoidia bacterium]|nr:helix-turn-helix transcriptional regulator [Dehalococcoidia bacterium]